MDTSRLGVVLGMLTLHVWCLLPSCGVTDEPQNGKFESLDRVQHSASNTRNTRLPPAYDDGDYPLVGAVSNRYTPPFVLVVPQNGGAYGDSFEPSGVRGVEVHERRDICTFSRNAHAIVIAQILSTTEPVNRCPMKFSPTSIQVELETLDVVAGSDVPRRVIAQAYRGTLESPNSTSEAARSPVSGDKVLLSLRKVPGIWWINQSILMLEPGKYASDGQAVAEGVDFPADIERLENLAGAAFSNQEGAEHSCIPAFWSDSEFLRGIQHTSCWPKRETYQDNSADEAPPNGVGHQLPDGSWQDESIEPKP